MDIVESKSRISALPSAWFFAITALVASIFLAGLRTRDPGSLPTSPLSSGLILSIDSENPAGNFGPSGMQALFALVEKVVPSDSEYADDFGISVSISGNTAAIGAPRRDDLGQSSGAVYVLEWDANAQTWTEIQKLLASDGGADQFFGAGVKIFGDTIFVSGFSLFVSTGKVYVYERDSGGPDNWGEVKIITPSVASGNSRFGISFDVSGDLLFVGAQTDTTPSAGTGSVFIFDRDLGGPDNWGEKLKIEPPAANTVWFGHSVSASGDTLLIGAPCCGSDGKAYVFEKDQGGPGSWGLVKTLTSPIGEDSFYFGETVGIDGNDAFVGSGSSGFGDFVYFYERNQGGAGNWGSTAVLGADDFGGSFGYPIVGQVSEERLILYMRSVGASFTLGRVLIFEQDAGGPDSWGLVQTIEPAATNELGDYKFGEAIAVDGNNLFIGHPGDFASGTPFRGSAFFYQRVTVTPSPSPTGTATSTPTVSPPTTATPSPTATQEPDETLIYLPIVIRSP